MTSEVVAGVGASHTTLMNTRWNEVDHLERAHAFRDALGTARGRLAELAPDLVVIFGSNHFRGFWLDLMPAFTIGVEVVDAAGEHGTPLGPQPTSPPDAMAICEALLRREFDVAYSTRIAVDHGITHAIQYLVPAGVPVVPIVINSFGPPLPSLARCVGLGTAVAGAISELPGDQRVAVIGTGGLSHQIPFPDWRSPSGCDEEFLAESFREGRGRWQEFEPRRRPIVTGATPRLNTAFDLEFLSALGAGTTPQFAARYEGDVLQHTAGNGANEIRAWLALAAACGHAPFEQLAYSPMPEWLTGMAVAMATTDRSANARPFRRRHT